MTARTAEGTPRDFLLPDLGEGLTEAEIVTWLVAVGDEVQIDQSVVEVESAKSVVELPSPYAGRVAGLHGEPGTLVHAGSPLITVLTDPAAGGRAQAPALLAESGTAEDAAESARAGSDEAGAEPVPGTALRGEAGSGSGAVLVGYGTRESTVRFRRPEGGRFRRSAGRADFASDLPDPGPALIRDPRRHSPVISPIVRKYARVNGLDASELAGTGPGALVLRADVDRAIRELAAPAAEPAVPPAGSHTTSAAPVTAPPAPSAAPATAPTAPSTSQPFAQPAEVSAPAAAPGTADVSIPLTGVRKLIADHLSHSRAVIPDATVWLDVDATELVGARERLQRLTGERFSFTALLARFVVEGLRKYPILNSSVDEEGGRILQHGAINLGIAAQTPRGLIVPVVHDTQSMTTRQLRDGIQELVTRAETGEYPPAMLAGGTFTLNNYGGFGVDGSSPIINHPEVAMLGVGRIIDRPWVVDGQIVVRKVLVLSIVFDHRVCDGEAASGFLTYVARCIQEPLLLLPDL